MRILHTSDWHLGRTLHGQDLSAEFEAWCEHVVALAREESLDAVLIAGDVYDRGVPPVGMVDLLSDTLARLLDVTQVVVTSGNHDSAKRLGFSGPLTRPGLTIRTVAQHSGKPIPIMKDGEVEAVVYGIPYLDPDLARHELSETEEPLARSHESVIAAAVRRIGQDMESGEFSRLRIPRLAMAHAFVTGGEASESERDLHIGGVDNAPSGTFRAGRAEHPTGGLDYVALGHLHGPQRVGLEADPLMRYSGSPVAFSFSEENHRKSSVLLDFPAEGGAPSVELIDAPVLRPLATLTGTMEELLSPANARHKGSYLRIRVTDPERPTNLMTRLSRAFDHVLETQHVSQATQVRAAEFSSIRNNPIEVVTEFFVSSGGRELTEKESTLVTDTWESVMRKHA